MIFRETTCREATSLFTPYMDGLLTGVQAQKVARHLSACQVCEASFHALRTTQSLVASLGRRQPPAELAHRLRITLAQENARRRRPLWKRGRRWRPAFDRMEQGLRAIMLPATAGLVSAVLCFAFVIGFFALPSPLAAASDDVPSGLFTPARLASAPFSIQDDCDPEIPVMVEVEVDASGGVVDYDIVSDEPASELPKLRAQLDNAFIFAHFEPAIFFGKPAPSRVVLSFSRVNVRA